MNTPISSESVRPILGRGPNEVKKGIKTVAHLTFAACNDPALVEKDYWIMHAVFGLKQLGLRFELKGGTSLSKGFGVIPRRKGFPAFLRPQDRSYRKPIE
jgi:hypothetical protein